MKQIEAKVKKYQDTEMRRNGTGDKARVHGQPTAFPVIGIFFLIVLDCLLDNACLGKS